jgi:prophage antirepressor-like protein|nr:MAG TPA: repressor domain protein [Bacteriophage sp.]
MNEIKLFTNKEFGEIRTMNIDEEPWFVGKDVAEALGYSNASKAVSTHVGEEDRILKVLEADSQNGNVVKTQTALINESGLYALIFGSKLESAKRFKHWVTSEVLPAIRKTGSYQKPMSPVEMMRIQLGMIDDHEGRITELEQNMTIDYGQQMSLGDIVNRVVVDSLGGKDSNAYHEIGRKVFSECNRDLKHYFNVNARNNVPKKKFDEAVDYVKNWQPCTNTRIMIQECNAQLSM